MVRSAAWGGRDYPLLTDHNLLNTWGADYTYTREYGMPGNTHPGWDVTMPVGTPLYALAPGVVDYIRAENYPTGTKEIVIRADGTGDRHLYTHTSKRLVTAGQRVAAGQHIGNSGDPTGLPHLHFEHRVPDGSTVSGWRIVDPGPLLTTAAVPSVPAAEGTYTPQSSVVGAILGTPAAWKAWARKNGVQNLPAFDEYVDEVYRLAGLRKGKGPQPHKLITQMLHETGGGTSEAWVTCRNPAGIGVTSDAMRLWFTFRDGIHAARAHYYHASEYSDYPVAPEIAAYRSDDPRAGSLPEEFRGTRTTLASYGDSDWRNNPTWAADDEYGEKWAGWLNRLASVFAGTTPTPVPEPEPEEPPVAVRFEKRIATNRLGQFGNLRDAAAYFTIHENGNPNSSPYDEAGFVASGGGSQGVMYHFAVGVEGGVPTIVQIFPVNRRGIHAGNSEGNAKSIAVETCMAPPGATSAPTQEALRELMYMLYTKDARIEGINAGYSFSPDRTVMHADWPGANPGCPQTMLAQWGGIQRPLAAVRQRLAGSPELPKPVPGATVSAGDQVAVSVDGLNVRAEPTTAAAVVQLAGPGAVMDVTGASTEADGYVWWPVKLGAATGYVAEKGTDGTPYIVVVKDAPAPPPEADPDQFARAVPIPEIATPVPYVKLANGSRLYRYQAKGKAVRATKLGQYASEGAKSIAPDAAAGSTLDLAYIVINPDASMYWYTDQHARVKFEDVEPVA